jgi:hypothetical protein
MIMIIIKIIIIIINNNIITIIILNKISHNLSIYDFKNREDYYIPKEGGSSLT